MKPNYFYGPEDIYRWAEYGPKNMNFWSIPERDEDPNVSPMQNNNVTSGETEVIFRGLEEKLVQQINQAEVVVGCVAWLTSPAILDALRGKDCQIIVQKEDFLRPDIGSNSNWKSDLRRRYKALEKMERFWLPGAVGKVSVCGDCLIDPIRCVGNYNRDKTPAFPRMHNKFMLFGSYKDTKYDDPECDDPEIWLGKFAPTSVWTGSFNFTKNAAMSLENALIIKDQKIVDAYAQEYGFIAAISEPLDWETDWAAPEFRIGT